MPSSRRTSSSTTSHAQATKNPRSVSKDLASRYAHPSPQFSDPASDRPKRTGRACVRCQRRKIKCDEGPNGCKNCLDAEEKCETKDPVSDNTTERGHTERLVLQLARKDAYNQRLVDFCRQHHLQPPNEAEDGTSFALPVAGVHPDPQIARHGILPEFNSQLLGENYIGVATTQPLTVPQGSRITLFDNKLDYNNFLEEDSPAYTLTDGEYNEYTSGRLAVVQPRFPPKQKAYKDAETFFSVIAVFTPVLHRPDFYNILDRIYDGQEPPASEVERVIVHTVLSVVNFQIAVRQGDYSLRDEAKQRFIYSLTFVQQLSETPTLVNLQALAMLCIAMRNLQRPGPAWKLCSRVFSLFVELGMHRSVASWETPPRKQTDHEIRMDQRLFWTMLVVMVNINAKFGRPMPIMEQNIDVEMPDPRPDSLPGEEESCSWFAAPYGFELTRIMLQVNTQLGALRQTAGDRDAILTKLLVVLDNLEQRLPSRLNGAEQNKPADIICGHYLHIGLNATKLLLRHPANLTSEDGFETSEVNLTACYDLARKIRASAVALKPRYALDTTLYYNMDFLCAIFVTIFVFDRRHQAARLNGEPIKHFYTELEREATKWRPVLEDVGQNLGSGTKLANAILRVFESCITRMRNASQQPIAVNAFGKRPQSFSAADHKQYDALQYQTMHARAVQHMQTGMFPPDAPSPFDTSTMTDSHSTTPGSETTIMRSPSGISMRDSVSPYSQVMPVDDIRMFDPSAQGMADMLPNGATYNFADPVLAGQGAHEFHQLGEHAFPPGWNTAQNMPVMNSQVMMQQQHQHHLQQQQQGPQWAQQFHMNHDHMRRSQ